MSTESQAIEVEVLEIDGVTPPPQKPHPQPQKTAASSSSATWQKSLKWIGRIRRLDRRWWPLWAVLGVILLFLILTVGLALGIIFAAFKIVSGFFKMLLR